MTQFVERKKKEYVGKYRIIMVMNYIGCGLDEFNK